MQEDKFDALVKRFTELAVKILIPMDQVINRLHRRENIRRFYFALADSRERLIQFLNIKKIDDFVIVLLKMNQLLNKITKINPESQFSDEEASNLIIQIADWRSLIYQAVVDMSTNGY